MKQTKKILIALLRLGIALAIMAYLLSKMELTSVWSVFAESVERWPWLLAAAGATLACITAGAARWKLILEAQDIQISWGRTISIYFIGYFFNSFMFGSTGGDVVRAYYATRETPLKKAEAAATVIIDRVIGMLVLFVMAGAMLIIKANFYINNEAVRLPAILMAAMILVAFGGVAALLKIRKFRSNRLFLWVEKLPKLGALAKRIASAFNLYGTQKQVLASTTLLSFLNHIFVVLLCASLGQSVKAQLTILDYLTAIPLIVSLSAIPITPGGLGVRDGLSVAVLGAMGVAGHQALSLSLLVYAQMLIWSAVGGAIFMFYTAGSGRALRDEMAELREEASGEGRQ